VKPGGREEDSLRSHWDSDRGQGAWMQIRHVSNGPDSAPHSQSDLLTFVVERYCSNYSGAVEFKCKCEYGRSKVCLLVALDLRKAFNCVSCRLLLITILRKAEIDPDWFKNYLADRFQCVKNSDFLEQIG
jgi:hypothetical protein